MSSFPYLVHLVCLLNLHLEQLLDRALNNLSSLLVSPCKRREWLFELRLHLRGNALVLLSRGLELAADCVQRSLQCSGFVGA